MLATQGLPDERRMGLTFELGRACEATGDLARARTSYQRVAEVEPSFPGIKDRIAALDSGGGGAAAPEAVGQESFENFDDFTNPSADEGYPEESDTESFESFDDVLTAGDEMPAADPGAAESKSSGGKKPPRKKKISFV